MIVERRWPTWNCFAMFGELYSGKPVSFRLGLRETRRTNDHILPLSTFIRAVRWLTCWGVVREMVNCGKDVASKACRPSSER